MSFGWSLENLALYEYPHTCRLKFWSCVSTNSISAYSCSFVSIWARWFCWFDHVKWWTVHSQMHFGTQSKSCGSMGGLCRLLQLATVFDLRRGSHLLLKRTSSYSWRNCTQRLGIPLSRSISITYREYWASNTMCPSHTPVSFLWVEPVHQYLVDCCYLSLDNQILQQLTQKMKYSLYSLLRPRTTIVSHRKLYFTDLKMCYTFREQNLMKFDYCHLLNRFFECLLLL